jgi:magnesium transporter
MIEIVLRAKNGSAPLWLDVQDPSPQEIEQLATEYSIPRPAIEEGLAPLHLPKHERLEDMTFIIARTYDEEAPNEADEFLTMSRKLVLFIGDRFLITIHRRPLPYLDAIKERAKRSKKTQVGPVMLEILLAGIDTFYAPLEEAELRVNEFESKLLAQAASARIQWKDVFRTKVRIQIIKRLLWHTQNVAQKYAPHGAGISLAAEIRERVNSLSFLAESLDDDLDNLLNVQLSLSADRTNDVVRVLTIFSAFFLPLTFIVGIYGMNFQYMPELSSRYGYPLVWLAIVSTVAGIYGWFRYRGWMR